MFVAKIRAAKEPSEALGCVVPAHYTSLRRTASCISKQLSGQFPPLVLAIIQKISGGKTIKPIVTAKALCRVLIRSPANGDLGGNSTRGSFSGSLLAETLRSSIPFRAAADIFFRYHTATVYPIAPAARGSLETYKREATPDFQDLGPRQLGQCIEETMMPHLTAKMSTLLVRGCPRLPRVPHPTT